MKFDVIQLESTGIDVIDGDRGKNYPHQNELLSTGFCLFLSAKNVTKSGFSFSETQFISQRKDALLNNGRLCRGDIVITTRGTVGNVALYSPQVPYENIRINSGMLIIRCANNISNQYLYQVLRSEWFQKQIMAVQSGSAQPQLPKSHFLKMNIPLPPLPIQEKIASILQLIDDKITTNNLINDNLEQQAQAIFKSWFVNYEPFGGIMPDDWYVSTLGKVSDMSAGGDKPNNATQTVTAENTIPIYSNGIANEGLYGFTDIAKIQDESVTVSARGTIGYVCLRQTPYVPIVRLVTLVPKKNLISAKYLYHWLKLLHIVGTGTTQQQLTVPSFKKTEIIIPAYSIMERFTKTVNPLYECVLANKSENQHLDSLRDTLLPKLMSGEIDVSEVQV